MNRYRELKKRQQEEFNAFPIIFAFNQEQLEKGIREKFGLDPKKDMGKLCRTGFGGFILKSSKKDLYDMLRLHKVQMREAIAEDSDGTGFIKDMFKDELANHEYVITGEYDDTFSALGLTGEQVFSDKVLLRGLKLAEKEYLSEVIL